MLEARVQPTRRARSKYFSAGAPRTHNLKSHGESVGPKVPSESQDRGEAG